MHFHECPSRGSSFSPVERGRLAFTISRGVRFPRMRVVRRKRLRDLNLDACITSEYEHNAHERAGEFGKKSDNASQNFSSRSVERSNHHNRMTSRFPVRRDECAHIFVRTRQHVRPFYFFAGGKRSEKSAERFKTIRASALTICRSFRRDDTTSRI